jgi:hypothetical protein
VTDQTSKQTTTAIRNGVRNHGWKSPNPAAVSDLTVNSPCKQTNPQNAPNAMSARSPANRSGFHANMKTVLRLCQESTLSATQYHNSPTAAISVRVSQGYETWRNQRVRGKAIGALTAIKSVKAGDGPGMSDTRKTASYHIWDCQISATASAICAAGNEYLSFARTFSSSGLLHAGPNRAILGPSPQLINLLRPCNRQRHGG